TIPEVARFSCGSIAGLERGASVVVETHRGLQVGTFLERVTPVHPADRDGSGPPVVSNSILRTATREDAASAARLQQEAGAVFDDWAARIVDWNLDLELIDLEWTLDRSKLILYVLSERGPDCTKLALQAAAAGLGIVEVQPVDHTGAVPIQSGHGCGNCGCGEK